MFMFLRVSQWLHYLYRLRFIFLRLSFRVASHCGNQNKIICIVEGILIIFQFKIKIYVCTNYIILLGKCKNYTSDVDFFLITKKKLLKLGPMSTIL